MIQNGETVFQDSNREHHPYRHTTCAAIVVPVPTKEELEDKQRRKRDKRHLGSAQRRRAGGHGYSDGDGFTDLW